MIAGRWVGARIARLATPTLETCLRAAVGSVEACGPRNVVSSPDSQMGRWHLATILHRPPTIARLMICGRELRSGVGGTRDREAADLTQSPRQDGERKSLGYVPHPPSITTRYAQWSKQRVAAHCAVTMPATWFPRRCPPSRHAAGSWFAATSGYRSKPFPCWDN